MKKKIILVFPVLFLLISFLLLANFLKNTASADTVTSTHPLPYLTDWSAKYSAQEMELVKRGHAILPNFPLADAPSKTSYQIKTLLAAKQLNLPLSLNVTQFEQDLKNETKYKDKDRDPVTGLFTGSTAMTSANPLNIQLNNTFTSLLDPLGPQAQIDLWSEVAGDWSNKKTFRFFTEIYPNPVNVDIVSNNEAPRMSGAGLLGNSKRYQETYVDTELAPTDYTARMNFQNRVAGDGWIARYGAMFATWRNNMTNAAWKNNLKFIAYNGFGDPSFRGYSGWATFTSTHTTFQGAPLAATDTVPRTSYYPYVWDGAVPDVILDPISTITDSRLRSNDFNSMNWPFMLVEARRANPNFTFEMSAWDGHVPLCSVTNGAEPCSPLCTQAAGCPDKRQAYTLTGQTWSPERYAAMEEYSLWLTRAQGIRQLVTATVSWADNLPYFLALTKVVDRVHQNDILRDFWQNGELVENPVGHHPYQDTTATAGYTDEEIKIRDGIGRWFYLYSNLDEPNRVMVNGSLAGFKDYDVNHTDSSDPATNTNVDIPVFSLAYTKGTGTNQEWLVYTHSPKQNRTGVTITVPGFDDITVDVSIGGNFYHLKASDHSVNVVNDSAAVLTHLVLSPDSPIVAPGATQQFSVTGKDQYDGDFSTGTVTWSATGGTIDQTGLFSAGTIKGDYEITAQSGSLTQTYTIKVDNVLAHWSFNEGTGTYSADASGRNNGCYNKDGWIAQGKYNSAAQFNLDAIDPTKGSLGVYCDSDEFMTQPKDFTISAWVNLNKDLHNGYIAGDPAGNLKKSYGLGYGYGGTGTGNFSLFAGEIPCATCNNGGPGTAGVQIDTGSTLTLEQNRWYHVVGVFKSGTDGYLRLYVDDVLKKERTTGLPTSISYDSQDFSVGQNFSGAIDDVIIYNQALDPSLVIDMTVDKTSAPIGENIFYTLTYRNVSNQPLNDAVITDVLSDRLTLVSAPGAEINGQNLTWTIPSIPANSSPQNLEVQCIVNSP